MQIVFISNLKSCEEPRQKWKKKRKEIQKRKSQIFCPFVCLFVFFFIFFFPLKHFIYIYLYILWSECRTPTRRWGKEKWQYKLNTVSPLIKVKWYLPNNSQSRTRNKRIKKITTFDSSVVRRSRSVPLPGGK